MSKSIIFLVKSFWAIFIDIWRFFLVTLIIMSNTAVHEWYNWVIWAVCAIIKRTSNCDSVELGLRQSEIARWGMWTERKLMVIVLGKSLKTVVFTNCYFN